jgi:syndecan 4
VSGPTARPGSEQCTTPRVCEAGNFINKDGNCTPCPAGQYSDTDDSHRCKKCPPRTYSIAGWKECIPCVSGPTAKPGSDQCTAPSVCAAGNYIDKDKNCIPCPAGQYSNKDNSHKCKKCPPDTYSIPGWKECIPCVSGPTAKPGSEQCTRPRPCKAGNYIDDETGCTPCPAGQHSTKDDSHSCKVCPTDTYSLSGSKTCTQCKKGTVSKPGSSTCAPIGCGAGSYFADGPCNLCPAGTYSHGGTKSCIDCSEDTFSDVGASKCTPCPSGYGCGRRSPPGKCTPKCSPGHKYCRKCPDGWVIDAKAGKGRVHCVKMKGGK